METPTDTHASTHARTHQQSCCEELGGSRAERTRPQAAASAATHSAACLGFRV